MQLVAIIGAERASRPALKDTSVTLHDQFTVNRLLGNARYPHFSDKWMANPKFRRTYNDWYRWADSDLNAMLVGLAENKYGVECECWCPAGVWAYVRPGAWWDDDIHFCPLFFKDTPERQVMHFTHEVSHLFADTDDLKLGNGRPWAENADDAHWYGEFGKDGRGWPQLDEFMRRFSDLFP
jgi:hypothetical protein